MVAAGMLMQEMPILIFAAASTFQFKCPNQATSMAMPRIYAKQKCCDTQDKVFVSNAASRSCISYIALQKFEDFSYNI